MHAAGTDMLINLDAVANVSRQVAFALDERLKVVALWATDGGGSRVEVLVIVKGCHREPCTHLLNVSRTSPDRLANEVRTKLGRALKTHPE